MILRIIPATIAILVASVVISRGESIVELGQDFKTIQTDRNERVTILRNGMHYWESGGWRETEEAFALQPDGSAVAKNAPHTVKLKAVADGSGTITYITPDAKEQVADFEEIRFFDSSSQKSISLGRRKPSKLKLLDVNRAIYEDISDGIKCDQIITFSGRGMESDIVLRAASPLPNELGLNPAITSLQVVTRFLKHSEVKVSEQTLICRNSTYCGKGINK